MSIGADGRSLRYGSWHKSLIRQENPSAESPGSPPFGGEPED